METSSKNEILEWIKSIGIAVILAMFIKTFLFNTILVDGISMEPTLQDGDRLIGNVIASKISKINRGDVVVLESPMNPKERYIKRVIGVEGDLIEIQAGEVYLNGEKLDEPYIEEGSYTETEETHTWIVDRGQVFILGDNRNPGASHDSRHFGTIPLNSIEGITKFRYYPMNSRFGKIDKSE